jgi:hypothetical protein
MDEDTIPDHVNPQYTDVPLQVLQMCQELSEISMFDAFGKRPFPWQRAIITHLNLMTCPASGIPPSPTFLCAPTGGGKSIARDSFSAGQGFVSWTITPLLSLGEDQVIKINVLGNSILLFYITVVLRILSASCLLADCTLAGCGSILASSTSKLIPMSSKPAAKLSCNATLSLCLRCFARCRVAGRSIAIIFAFPTSHISCVAIR